MPEFDPYSVLGIEKTSSSIEIKKAYRSLALKFHPDKNNNKDEHDKFKDIAHAYDILSDPEKRKQHDLLSRQRNRPAFNTSFNNFNTNPAFNYSSAFNFKTAFSNTPHPRSRFFTRTDFFGNSSIPNFFPSNQRREPRPRPQPQTQPQSQPQPQPQPQSETQPQPQPQPQPQASQNEPPPNVEATVNVQLKDLYNGKKVTVTHPVSSICSGCKGDNRRKVIQQPCGVCKGHGCQTTKSKSGKMTAILCKGCKGSGNERIYTSCSQCHGGSIRTERKLTFVIPKGHPMDKPIIFEKETGLLGDLIVRFQVVDWNGFRLTSGANLYRKITITLQEALFGFDKVLFTHMDGRQIKVKHPAGDVIKPGVYKRIHREGMPKSGVNDANGVQSRGDLFIEFDVDFPDKLDLPNDISQLKSCFPEPFVVTEDGPVEECSLEISDPDEFLPGRKAQDDDDATDSDETDELDDDGYDDNNKNDKDNGNGEHNHSGEEQNRADCVIM